MREEECYDEGNAILAWRGFVGSALLGKRGKRAEEVAQECLASLRREGDVDVDLHLSDQLLIYAALAGKTSFKTSNVSNHTTTCIHIVEKFLGRKFSAENSEIKVD